VESGKDGVMAKRENHYEAAFEAYLRWLAVPYITVDETHRSLIGRCSSGSIDASQRPSLKSIDFVVSPPNSPGSWLVDVKGRRFPTGKSYFKNWSTADELSSLAAWEELFAVQAKGLLVFAYNVVGDRAPLAPDELFVFRGGLYGFVGIELAHYASWSKQLSPRWGTVTVPVAQFRSLARPARELFGAQRPQAA
jgi:hypothetical protein